MSVLKAVMVFMVLLLAGCAQGPVDEGTATRSGRALLTVEAIEYRLGSGDQLRINVFGEDALTGEYFVGAQGTVAFPLVGDVPATGKTLVEFSRDLETRLRAGFVREPRVTAEVMNYRPFFILGEVASPSTYPYSAGLTVMNAVATAGGFTPRADRRRVFIKHAGQAGEQEYALTSTTPVQPGDTVRIAERLF